MISTYDYEYKIVLVGDPLVGKSSIIKRFTDETFQEILLDSLGVTFTHKIVNIDEKIIKLNLYDLSGQQKFHSIAPCVYNHSHALILCFDVSNSQSFDNICRYWFKELEDHNRSHCDIFLIGNKIDSQRKVEQEKVQEFAKKHNIYKIYYVSAKENANIEQTFRDLAFALYKQSKKIVSKPGEQNCKLAKRHSQQGGKCYQH